jgi:carboxyl-terminal processing protease
MHKHVARCTLHVLRTALLLAAAAPATGQTRSNYEELQAFSGVLNHIRLNYVDSVTYGRLVRAAIDGVLRALDPHSYYISRAEVEREGLIRTGELGVIGVHVEPVEGIPTIVAVMPDGPADDRGVMPGDRIIAIDDSAVAGLEPHQVRLRLAGRKGSHVRLTLDRGPRLEPERLSVRVRRDELRDQSVGFAELLDDSTGYVWLSGFGERAADQLEDALNGMRRRMRRLVLDLRSNPGGRVIESVEIAALFFPRNTLVFRVRGRKNDIDEDFVTQRDGRYRDLPLVVLIDERSASAAEALAGSLQDHDRALLLGRRSFGKALMQTVFLVPGGDNVWLTVGRVVSPSGRFIQRRYAGLTSEQYRALAGVSGAEDDTTATFVTGNGRVVRGGGGIVPDVALEGRLALPAWFTAAADTGLDVLVADSVASTLVGTPAGFAAWIADSAAWHDRLVEPFLALVRARLAVRAEVDAVLAGQLARRLAGRSAEVRWGTEAGTRFLVRTDPAVRRAVESFAGLAALLAPSRN